MIFSETAGPIGPKLVEWSSDGPLWELCPTTPAANQDSRRY
jgi:hypothetical protein